MQHVAMNIEAKHQLFGEIRRVLRPRGRLVFHEVLSGTARLPPHFPLPWADVRPTLVVTDRLEHALEGRVASCDRILVSARAVIAVSLEHLGVRNLENGVVPILVQWWSRSR